MIVRLHEGYWTIFVREKPIASCATFKAAIEAVEAIREATCAS